MTTKPLPAADDIADLPLLGGRLCLDFVNTVKPRVGDLHDFLAGYADLVLWAVRTTAVPDVLVGPLLRAGERQPKDAQAALERARDLREQLYQLFSALAHRVPAPGASIDHLSRAIADAAPHARLVNRGSAFVWAWDDQPHLDRPWWSVTRSSVALLTDDDHTRIHQCPPDEGCGWLFFDTSRNGSRRWCSMNGCGNRAKGRRHYDRQRDPRPLDKPGR